MARGNLTARKKRENIGEIGEYRFWNIFSGGRDRFFLAFRVSNGGEWIFITSLSSIGYYENFYGERIIAAVNSRSFVS